MQQETAHVLFMDIVGYSRLPDDEQARVFRLLQEMVADCPSVIDASHDDRIVRTPTGDGMALSFFGDATAPRRCAEELTERIAKDSPFAIRMGINSGPVVRQIDINRNTNVSGDGINTAQRVMNFGDSGHVLLSEDFAHALGQRAADAQDIGTATAKHAKRVRLFNLHNEAIGNAAIPLKVRKDPAWARPAHLRLGLTSRNLFVGALQILSWIIAQPQRWREHVAQIDPDLNPSFSVVELNLKQVKANPDLLRLVGQTYAVCPVFLLAFATGLALISGAYREVNSWYSVAFVCGFVVMPFALGAAPGLAFLIFESTSVIQSRSPALIVVQVTIIAAAVGWLIVTVPRLAEQRVMRSPVRELLAAFAGIALCLVAAAALAVPVWRYFYRGQSERFFDVLTYSGMALIVVNGAFGIRWRQWSRGFASGQAVGALIAVGYGFVAGFKPEQLATRAADISWAPREAFPAGLGVGMMDAMAMAFAFAVADRISGARAAVLAPLGMFAVDVIVDPSMNAPALLRPLPLIALAAGYVISRRKR